MNNEELMKAKTLSESISDLKDEMQIVKNCHNVRGASFSYGHSHHTICESFIDFTKLKAQVLVSMKKKLAEMEKEFAKL